MAGGEGRSGGGGGGAQNVSVESGGEEGPGEKKHQVMEKQLKKT